MKVINVGIIGFGLSGKIFHSSLLKANTHYKIKKIYTSRVDEVQNFVPGALAVSDIDEVFKDNKIDLVIICGPNSTHFDHCKRALIENKHVVVEKPFVTCVDQGQELIDLALNTNKLLSVFHNRRWDSDFLTIKHLIESNSLGAIKQFESHFDRWRPTTRKNKWKELPGDGVGILFDLGSHLIDQALCLFGEPEAVLGDIVDQKENNEIDDYFHIILKYNKMRVILHSTSFSNQTPRFQVFGDKGSFVKHGFDPQESALVNEEDIDSHDFGVEPPDKYGVLTNYFESRPTSKVIESEIGNYNYFYNQIAKSINTNDMKLNPVNPISALNVIKIIELLKKSSDMQQWVQL